MMRVELTDAATADVVEVAIGYELERPGLGFRFEAEFDAALERIREHPRLYVEISPSVRRVLMRVFPYSVYFTILDAHVRIFAVLHQHRHPRTWKTRVR